MSTTSEETTAPPEPAVPLADEDAEATTFPPDEYAERMAWMQDPELAVGVDPAVLAGKVIAVAGTKGGIGKTTFATELAYLLGGLLVDFEFDTGSAAVALGHKRRSYVRSPILDALEKQGRTPRIINGGPWRPDFVPGDKEFEANQPSSERMGQLILEWAEVWAQAGRGPIVIDTHPGGLPSTIGAMDVADVIVVPTVLKDKELNALEGLLEDHADGPLLLAPNMTKWSPPNHLLNRLKKMQKTFKVAVAPPVHKYDWLGERTRRTAVCGVGNGRAVPKKYEEVVFEFQRVAKAVAQYVA